MVAALTGVSIRGCLRLNVALEISFCIKCTVLARFLYFLLSGDKFKMQNVIDDVH